MDLRGKSSEFIRNLCRMCMCSRASVDMGRNTSIYKQYLHEKPTGGNGQQHLTIAELLQSVQPNLINETEDKLPQVLCLRCIDQLQTTYEFLQMCRDSDKRYRKVLLEIPPQIHSEDSNVDHLNSDEEFSFVTVKQEEFLDMEVSTHSGNYGELEMSLSGQHTNNHSDDNDDEWTPTGKRRKTANTKNYKLAKPNESNSTANRLPPPNEEDGIPCRECGKVLANVSLWEKHLADCRLGISPNNEERNTVNINMTDKMSKINRYENLIGKWFNSLSEKCFKLNGSDVICTTCDKKISCKKKYQLVQHIATSVHRRSQAFNSNNDENGITYFNLHTQQETKLFQNF